MATHRNGGRPARTLAVMLCSAMASAYLGACGDDGSANPRNATFLWQDSYDSGAMQGAARDVANDVAACGGRVHVVGETASEYDGEEDFFHTRTYAAADGALLWEQRIESGPGDSARIVVCDANSVIVTGILGRQATIQAYDAETGNNLWSRTIDDGDENDITGLVVQKGVVYIASRATTTIDGESRSYVTRRALSANGGTLIWEDRTKVAAPWATATIDVGGGRVCTLTSDQGDGLVYSVRCLRRSDGTLAWQRRLGSADRVESEVLHFLPGGDALVAATADSDGSVLEAFAANDGRRLWKRNYPGLAVVVDIEATSERVLIAGVEFVFETRSDGDISERDILFVEGRDPASGDQLWEYRVLDTQPREIAVDGLRLIVGGVNWRSWVFDILSGRLVIDEPPAPEPPARWMFDVAAADGRYYLVGAFFASDDDHRNLDFGVRAYAR